MTAVLIGQILGISFACGLNLYLAVATLGILSRLSPGQPLPTGLHGLESVIVIGSALALFLIEAVVDKIRHADSVWDTVHTLIRPPAAALLAVGAAWGLPAWQVAAAATIALLVASVAHGTKAGFRLTLNATRRGGHVWLSVAEDALAVGLAALALFAPAQAALVAGALLALLVFLAPRFWRALRLGVRCLAAWLRAFFSPSRWREYDEMPRRVRRLLDPTPLGAARPQGARAALHGFPGTGAYRNGWLVITGDGPVFVYDSWLGTRRVDLPPAAEVRTETGVWADTATVQLPDEAGSTTFTLFILKDGPTLDLAARHLSHTPT